MNNKGQYSYVGILIMIFIIIIVGGALLSPIASNTATAQATAGISNTPSSTLIGLNVLMYSLLILCSVSGLVYLILYLSGFV
jgi:hypothetical protein